MKISISSHCFATPIHDGDMTILDAIKKVKELGVSGIEFTTHDDSIDIEYAKQLRAEADRLGVEIVNYAIDSDFVTGANGRTIEEEMARLKKQIDIAEVFGVKNIRHDVINSLEECRSFDLALPIIAERIREISKYAETKGIRTTVENHGRICQDPDRMERLFNAVNYKNFGLLCDIGNFIVCDYDPVEAVSKVAPYAFFAHVKDYYIKSGSSLDDPGAGIPVTRGGNYFFPSRIGYGSIPITQCLKILKSAGYDGYISIEIFLDDPIEGLKTSIANLQRYIDNVY